MKTCNYIISWVRWWTPIIRKTLNNDSDVISNEWFFDCLFFTVTSALFLILFNFFVNMWLEVEIHFNQKFSKFNAIAIFIHCPFWKTSEPLQNLHSWLIKVLLVIYGRINIFWLNFIPVNFLKPLYKAKIWPWHLYVQ